MTFRLYVNVNVIKYADDTVLCYSGQAVFQSKSKTRHEKRQPERRPVRDAKKQNCTLVKKFMLKQSNSATFNNYFKINDHKQCVIEYQI